MFNGLINRLMADGTLHAIANNPLAPFGKNKRVYLGQLLMPEKNVSSLEFQAVRMRYTSIIANSGTRYSPAQMKNGTSAQQKEVRLGHSDIKGQFTASDYDLFKETLRLAGVTNFDNASMAQISTLLNWFNKAVVIPLIELNEKNRWQAICNASVVLTGDSGYSETIAYEDPAGHRVDSSIQWSDNADDPYTDLTAMAEIFEAKGRKVKRIIWSSQASSKFRNNTNIRERVGRFSIGSGSVVGVPGRASKEDIAALFQEDGLPAPEEYNLVYKTDTGSDWFLPRDKVVFIAETDDEYYIDLDDQEPLIIDGGIGRVAMGPAAGQDKPGRAIWSASFDNKPPRIEAEGWQASIPYLEDDESVAVLTLVSDTFTSTVNAPSV